MAGEAALEISGGLCPHDDVGCELWFVLQQSTDRVPTDSSCARQGLRDSP
ncbi:hypothetical protein ABID95_001110 [Streptomyces atratus]